MDSSPLNALTRVINDRLTRRCLGRIAWAGALTAAAMSLTAEPDTEAKRRIRGEHNIRGNKAVMCFEGETIRVPRKKRTKWLRNGATRGKCESACVPSCPPGSCDIDDGCGGSCPGCAAGSICAGSVCQACTITCDTTSGPCGAELEVALLTGGNIYLCPGSYQGPFSPTANANLYGAGSGDDESVDTILTSGKSTQTIVVTEAVQVLFSGLRITDGGPQPYGGNVFISSSSANVTVANSVVTNGLAGYGAAFYIDGGTLAIQDCEIIGNAATTNGAGLFVTEVTGVPSVTITNTTFSDNTADSDGAAIYTEAGTTSLTGSTIRSNTAVNNGGGIYCANGTVNLAADVAITQNTAMTGTGGGIYEQAGTVNVNGATVSNNSPDQCDPNIC